MLTSFLKKFGQFPYFFVVVAYANDNNLSLYTSNPVCKFPVQIKRNYNISRYKVNRRLHSIE